MSFAWSISRWIIEALKQFDVHITDHQGLQWLVSVQKEKLAAAVISDYKLSIYHESGELTAHVDALSRLLANLEVPDRAYVNLAQVEAPNLKEVLVAVQAGRRVNDDAQAKSVIRDNLRAIPRHLSY